ncbi:MAG: sigma-70 family RNA polymerase sigma factor [Proteobacteria bacterium]|nr:sigma-70 family RNA polymerase sigma factor [Pseudomonadota bacterium]
MHEADCRLVARMLAGEQRAFNEFYAMAAQRLAAFVRRRSSLDEASVEDLVQETLVKAVRSLDGYRGEAALFTWVVGICRNRLIDQQRHAHRRTGGTSLDEAAAHPEWSLRLRAPEAEQPEQRTDAERRGAAIMRALRDLPEPYATLLEAKYGDGLTMRQIARERGITVVAVQSLLARARAAFRSRWHAHEAPSESGGSTDG